MRVSQSKCVRESERECVSTDAEDPRRAVRMRAGLHSRLGARALTRAPQKPLEGSSGCHSGRDDDGRSLWSGESLRDHPSRTLLCEAERGPRAHGRVIQSRARGAIWELGGTSAGAAKTPCVTYDRIAPRRDDLLSMCDVWTWHLLCDVC